MHIPQIDDPSSTPPVLPPSDPKTISQAPPSINYIFDTSASADLKAVDEDLWNAILEIKSLDLSGQQQAMMIDILLAIRSIRQQNMEIWQSQANNAFRAGMMMADKQEAQAKSKAITTGVTNAASAIQAGIELGATVYGAVQANRQNAQITRDADNMNWTLADGANGTGTNGTAGATGAAATPAPTAPPPAYTPEADLSIFDADGNPIVSDPIPAKKAGMDGTDPANAPGADGKDPHLNPDAFTRRQQYVADRQRSLYIKEEMHTRIANAVGQLIAAGLKGGVAANEVEEGRLQAEATVQQTIMNYLSNQSQFSKEYAGELQQFLNSLLDYIKTAEQSRHQAANSIASIV